MKTYFLLAHRRGERVLALVRSEDAPACRAELVRLGLDGQSEVVPLSEPRLLRLRGPFFERARYFLWCLAARRFLSSHRRKSPVASVHQVTFATGLLPHACPRQLRQIFMWGPISIRQDFGRLARWAGLEFILKRLLAGYTKNLGRIIAQNDFTLARLRDCNNLSSRSLVLEPNVVAEMQEGSRASDRRQLIAVGRLEPVKRFDLAIRALSHDLLANFRLVVVGDGSLIRLLRLLALELGVEKRVDFLGWQNPADVRALMLQSGAMIHPSRSEGSSWVVGEATAAGLPVVVFKGTGAETILRLSGGNGHVVNDSENPVDGIIRGVRRITSSAPPIPVDRWAEGRLLRELPKWWAEL